MLLAGASSSAMGECRSIDDQRWDSAAKDAPGAVRPDGNPVPPAGAGTTPASPAANASGDLASVSRDQIVMLRRASARLSGAAKRTQLVLVCGHQTINAMAVAAGNNVPPSGLVAITTGMMSVIGTDEVMAASMLAHEIAHLSLQHGLQRQRVARVLAQRAGQAGAASERAQAGSGLALAQAIFVTQMSAYSREIERQADDEGYELFAEAGYDPRGATRLFESVRARVGTSATSYLSSHPGFDERISRTLVLARDDSARAAAVEGANAIAAENEKFRISADELLRSRRWGDLSALVKDWLAALPNSGLGWYYRGLVLNGAGARNDRAWEAFARAAELDPNRLEAWDALVESLLAAGYRREAAACVATMSATGLGTRDLRERLFDAKLFVHGRSRRVFSELWWSREASGSRFITNDRSLLVNRGVDVTRVPPEWVPVK